MKSLTESDAESRIKNRKNDDNKVRDIRVVDKRLQVKYEDDWVDETHIKNIMLTDFDFVYDTVESDYEVLKNAVNDTYNYEIGMWRVDYDTFSNGNIKSLYVPFNTDLVDDKVIYNIYSEDSIGDYELKKQVENMPIPSNKLETKKLFVDSLDNGTVKTDVEVKYGSRIKKAFKKVETEVDKPKLNDTKFVRNIIVRDSVRNDEYVGTRDNSIYIEYLKSIINVILFISQISLIVMDFFITRNKHLPRKNSLRDIDDSNQDSIQDKKPLKRLLYESAFNCLCLIYIVIHILTVARVAYNMDDIKKLKSVELIDV